MKDDLLRVGSPSDFLDGIIQAIKHGLRAVSSTRSSHTANETENGIFIRQGLDFGNEGRVLRRMISVGHEGELHTLDDRALESILNDVFANRVRLLDVVRH